MADKTIQRVFIFNYFDCQPTAGGPSGVLGQCLSGHEGRYFHLNPVHPLKYTPLQSVRNILLPGRLPSFFRNGRAHCAQIFKRFKAADYPVLYFHDIYSLAFSMDFIGADQTVVLQSHAPELPHEEFAQLPYATDELVAWVAEAERRAFLRADCLVFPNEGVLELYSPLMTSRSMVRYLETGARRPAALQKIPLDKEKIHLLYIGRRNAVKGFDIILEAFKGAHRAHPELSLIVVGNGETVHAEGVADVGFSRSPHDWINSCDFVVNCNRQSYFDLIAIETLAVGTPLIVSENYGHQVFASLGEEGILPIGAPTVDNLREVLDPARLRGYMSPEVREGNRKLYEARFSDAVYRRHLDLLCKDLLAWHLREGRGA